MTVAPTIAMIDVSAAWHGTPAITYAAARPNQPALVGMCRSLQDRNLRRIALLAAYSQFFRVSGHKHTSMSPSWWPGLAVTKNRTLGSASSFASTAAVAGFNFFWPERSTIPWPGRQAVP